MPLSEAFVTRIGQDGTAEVIIQTGQACCIPGPPELSDHHNPGPGTLTAKVSNQAGAAVGDLVSLAHPPGAVKKSIATLLGIPFAGLILGTVCGVILYQLAVIQMIATLIFAAGGLFLGFTFGLGRYRRMGQASLPVIERIIKTGLEAPPCEKPSEPLCQSCHIRGDSG